MDKPLPHDASPGIASKKLGGVGAVVTAARAGGIFIGPPAFLLPPPPPAHHAVVGVRSPSHHPPPPPPPRSHADLPPGLVIKSEPLEGPNGLLGVAHTPEVAASLAAAATLQLVGGGPKVETNDDVANRDQGGGPGGGGEGEGGGAPGISSHDEIVKTELGLGGKVIPSGRTILGISS